MSTNDTEFYFTNFKRLQYATHIVRRDTGEEIKSFKEIAGIYGYMRDQYESYSNKKLEFFESLESIGLHFHGMDRRTVKKFIDVLNAIGLVNSVKQKQKDYGYDRYHHTVIPLEKIADNLIFYGPEKMSGGPLAEGMLIRELEKKKPRGTPKKKKTAQPKNEEKKGDDESDQGNAEQRDGVPDIHSDRHDDVSANDAVNERYYADLDTLNNWVEGYDDEGFMAYGAMWGIAKPGAITDLIKSHIRKIQSNGSKGSRSAANDTLFGADAIYKQRQAQRAAEAKQATNAPQQQEDEQLEFNDDEPF
ncbi:hypothetical protein D6Y75_08700 [Escherichia coli]|nr:hypothetical protein [Escherichia coli]EFH3089221.1 hypothetical protein [Escherichia coli]EIQ2164582.1 hypothetical protein [Escherichia coli]HEI2663192.1 hypothetical protein [Escherichia coli]